MKTKRFFSIVCLTVALSVNSLPVYAQIPWDTITEALKLLNSPAAQQILLTINTPKSQEFPAFSDGEWLVTFKENGNDLIYYGANVQTKADIVLRNVTIQGNQQRRVFSWNNGDYTYQVAYQPSDPDFLRLQVFEGSELLLDRLLRRYEPN